MTAIVGIEHDGVIYMGGDSAISGLTQLRIIEEPKVFVNDTMIIGVCGSVRLVQLMKHAFTPPDKPERKDDMTYMVTDVVDSIRGMQRDKGTLKKENEQETHESDFLIGYNGRLYYVEEQFEVYRTPDQFGAVGAGSDIAMGVLYATKDSALTPEQRIMLALEAAEAYTACVRRPFYVMKFAADDEGEK